MVNIIVRCFCFSKWFMARYDEFLWVKDSSKIFKKVFARMMKKEAVCMGKLNSKMKVDGDLKISIVLNLSMRYWQWSASELIYSCLNGTALDHYSKHL